MARVAKGIRGVAMKWGKEVSESLKVWLFPMRGVLGQRGYCVCAIYT